MATLTGQQIDGSYQGLIKTTDNGAISGTAKAVTDGLGNATNIEISNTATNFVSGTVDFTGSTVSGLPAGSDTTYDLASAQDGANVDVTLTGSDATTDTVQLTAGTNITLTDNGSNNITIDAAGGGGAAGLESGTGTDSMQSAAALTTNPADAANLNSVALGDNAAASTDGGIAIGHDTRAYGNASSVAIGDDADGHNGGVGIGDGAQAFYGSVAIGKGASSTFTTYGNVHIGENAKNTTGGNGANVTIGVNAQQTSNAEYSTAIGYGSTVSADNAVALGANVTAATDDTVSVKALETQTDSTPTAGGIIMSDAGGTDRRININSNGDLQVDGDQINKAFSVGRYSGISTDFSCDTIQSTVLIPGGTFKAGDILQFNGMEQGAGGTGWCYTAFWLSTNGTIGNGGVETMNMCQTQTSAADWKTSYQKTIYVHTADGTGAGTTIWPAVQASDVYNSGPVTGGDAINTEAVDWTSDIYLVSRICIDNTGTTYTNHGGVLRKIN